MGIQRIKTAEVEKMVETGAVETVDAIETGAGYRLMVRGLNGSRWLLETSQGETREFRSLDAVASLMRKLGLRSFSVQV